jgi:hypothetical protein
MKLLLAVSGDQKIKSRQVGKIGALFERQIKKSCLVHVGYAISHVSALKTSLANNGVDSAIVVAANNQVGKTFHRLSLLVLALAPQFVASDQPVDYASFSCVIVRSRLIEYLQTHVAALAVRKLCAHGSAVVRNIAMVRSNDRKQALKKVGFAAPRFTTKNQGNATFLIETGEQKLEPAEDKRHQRTVAVANVHL